jgi:small conductance mechanosensitive channel
LSTNVTTTTAVQSAIAFPNLDFLYPLFYFAIIIIATYIVASLSSIIISRLMRESYPLLAAQARRVGWVIVWLIGIILAIEQLTPNSSILLLVVGLSGAGAIVALRVPLENIGAKYFQDVYIPFKIGDTISVQGHYGKVVEVNSVSTILLTEDDQLISIPNSVFVKDVVINSTPQAWKEVTIPIAIESSVDLAEFESAVLKSMSKLKIHLDRRFPPVLTTKSRGPQSTELTLTVMIQRPEERDAIVTEINKRVSEIMQTSQQKKK